MDLDKDSSKETFIVCRTRQKTIILIQRKEALLFFGNAINKDLGKYFWTKIVPRPWRGRILIGDAEATSSVITAIIYSNKHKNYVNVALDLNFSDGPVPNDKIIIPDWVKKREIPNGWTGGVTLGGGSRSIQMHDGELKCHLQITNSTVPMYIVKKCHMQD